MAAKTQKQGAPKWEALPWYVCEYQNECNECNESATMKRVADKSPRYLCAKHYRQVVVKEPHAAS